MGFKTYPRSYFELLLTAFILIMSMSLTTAFLPLFAKVLDPSGVLVGFAVSAWSFFRIFTELPSGILADRLGRRRLLVGGLALAATGTFLCSVATSIHMLIGGRALTGLGTALFFLSSSAILFDLFRSRIRGRALGSYHSLEFVGGFVGAPIGSFLAATQGYREVFLLAGMLMLCSFFIAFVSRELRQADASHSTGSSRLSFLEIVQSLRSRELIAIGTNSFSRMMIWRGISSTIFPLYLNLELGIGVELIGLIVSMKTVGLIIATVTSGYLSDRFGRRVMIVLGLLLQAGCFCVYTSIFQFEMFLLIGLFEGFSRGMVLTSLMVLLSEVVPPRLRGAGIGVYRTFMDIGGLIGPLFFMLIYSLAGSNEAFLSAIVVIAVNIATVMTVKRPKKGIEG